MWVQAPAAWCSARLTSAPNSKDHHLFRREALWDWQHMGQAHRMLAVRANTRSPCCTSHGCGLFLMDRCRTIGTRGRGEARGWRGGGSEPSCMCSGERAGRSHGWHVRSHHSDGRDASHRSRRRRWTDRRLRATAGNAPKPSRSQQPHLWHSTTQSGACTYEKSLAPEALP